MHRRTRWSSLPASALVVASLAACSGDDTAGAPPTIVAASTAGSPGTASTVPVADTAVAPATPPPPSFTTPATVFDDTGGLGSSSLADVALATGEAQVLATVGTEIGVLGIAIGPSSTIDAITDAPALLTFDEAAAGQAEGGLPVDAGGATLLALARRPSDGVLFAIGDGGEIVVVDPLDGSTTPVATVELDDPGVGLDVTDDGVLEVVVATGRRFDVDPAAGTVTAFAALTGDGPTLPRIVAVAHRGEGRYGIDSDADTLVRIADDGTVTTVGPLGLDVTDGVSLDIAGDVARLANPG